MTIAAGSKLGPYEIVAPIGAGGMGEVFRARDTRLGRDVAVKVLPALFTADPDRLRRFESEARAAAALNHPNILVVYDVGAEAGIPYVVSELLEGQTLRQVLERGALPTRKAVDYATQMANGLAAAHDKGIVHRDLKPENLFVTKDGRVKILDFGLAKLAEAVTSDGSRATLAQTDPGMVVGTAGYMSPEQLRSEPLDARSDVFSLGAVLYEMFTGQRAFKGKTAVDTMSAILKEDPADFPSGVHASSPALERIVRRCLEKNVDERFQSARDVTFALEAISTASGIKPAEVAPAGIRARRFPWVIAVVGGAAALALAAYLAGSTFRARPQGPPAVTQLTFRSGDIRGARFSPDGKTVIYAAAWEGDALRIFTTRPGSPESSPLDLPPADLLAVSPSAELAIGLNPRVVTFGTYGTLATVALSGGAPRELQENGSFADWSADGTQMAAIFDASPTDGRLEFPFGTERLHTPYWLSDVRISPDGAEVAFIAHTQFGDDGNVEVIGRTGSPRVISSGWLSVQGLAWAPGGRELWVTGTRAGMLRAVWGLSLDGHERLIYRAPVRLWLQDLAPDGRALLTGVNVRSEIRFGSLKAKTERGLSWFDFATGISMSADAKSIAFNESGEGAGNAYGIFVRPTDGGPAVRLADGGVSFISPDGMSVLMGQENSTDVNWRLVPTGAGRARSISLKPLVAVADGHWRSDSRHFVAVGNEPGRGRRSYDLDVSTGRITPLTPEGITGTNVSPDGHWLASAKDEAPGLFDLHTQAWTPLKVEPKDQLAGWSADSKSIFVAQTDLRSARLFQIDLATGARAPLSTLTPSDPAGLVGVSNVVVAPDGDHYVYRYTRQLSELFLVDLAGR